MPEIRKEKKKDEAKRPLPKDDGHKVVSAYDEAGKARIEKTKKRDRLYTFAAIGLLVLIIAAITVWIILGK